MENWECYPVGILLNLLALQEHFGNSSSASKVAVDLKGRMVVEKIGKGRFGEESPQVFQTLFSIKEPCPKIDDPGPTPSRVAASM